MKECDRVVTDDKQMADMLNTYFCSGFTHEDLANMRNPEQLYRGEEKLRWSSLLRRSRKSCLP